MSAGQTQRRRLNGAGSGNGHPKSLHLDYGSGHNSHSQATARDTLDKDNDVVDGKERYVHDWHDEGPGRRIGYDDLSTIDWVFEYTKERRRLKQLYSDSNGIVGQIRRLLDSSQIWLVLIASGVAAGLLAAGIDVASDWLGDLKTGFCSGSFYLNRGFCCWGHDASAQCQGWRAWGPAFLIQRPAGRFLLEYTIFILCSVAFAMAAALLVHRYAKYARHSGIPEIKTVLGGFLMNDFLSGWTLLIKSLGLCLAVASGLWLGKEGPLVHVACCCANMFMKFTPSLSSNEARKREILSAAASAGISVAFGSPIGGVLFSLEQLSYYFPDQTMWQSFVCAMLAAVTLQAFNPFRTGKLVLYQVIYTTSWHGFELGPYAFLGVLGGLYGGLFIKLNMKIAHWRRKFRWTEQPLNEVLVVAILTAIVNFPNKFMRAQSSELVYMLFAECASITDDQFGICEKGAASAGVILQLLQAAIVGCLLASVTFGLHIPAGIILPSMAIGGLSGRAVGVIMEIWQERHPTAMIFSACEPEKPCITPGTYAIIGAAAALGGVTRMTVSIVVIMFELTGALTYVLPIMIAVMISKWVGDAFGKSGVYESWIHFKEYPFLDNRNDTPVPDVFVDSVMTGSEELITLSARSHTIDSLKKVLSSHSYRGFPVISDETSFNLLGYISRTELVYAIAKATESPRALPLSTPVFFTHQADAVPSSTLDMRPWMDQTPITLNVRSSLQIVVDMFSRLGLRHVMFTHEGRLCGLLTKKDIWYMLQGESSAQANMSNRDGDRDVPY